MEIRDYLRAHRRRAVGVLLLPVVAAGVTAGVTASRPPQHTGSVVVTVPPAAAESGAALLRFADDYSQAVTSPGVLDRTAEATGLPRREVREGLEVRRLGAGGRLRVSMVGDDPDLVGEVAVTAARQTFSELSQPRVDIARLAFDDVQRRFTQVDADREAFRARTGLVSPPARVQSLVIELGDLTARVEREQAAGEAERAATAAATLKRKQAELEATRALVPEYLALDTAVDQAQGPVDRAQEDLREADVVLLAGTLPSAVTPAVVSQVPSTRTVLQPAAVAAALALFLGVGLLVLLDLLRTPEGRRPRREEVDAAPTGAAAPANMPPAAAPSTIAAKTAAPAVPTQAAAGGDLVPAAQRRRPDAGQRGQDRR